MRNRKGLWGYYALLDSLLESRSESLWLVKLWLKRRYSYFSNWDRCFHSSWWSINTARSQHRSTHNSRSQTRHNSLLYSTTMLWSIRILPYGTLWSKRILSYDWTLRSIIEISSPIGLIPLASNHPSTPCFLHAGQIPRNNTLIEIIGKEF